MPRTAATRGGQSARRGPGRDLGVTLRVAAGRAPSGELKSSKARTNPGRVARSTAAHPVPLRAELVADLINGDHAVRVLRLRRVA